MSQKQNGEQKSLQRNSNLYIKLNNVFHELYKDPVISGVIGALLGVAALTIIRATFPGLKEDLLFIISSISLIVFLALLKSRRSLALSAVSMLLILAILVFFLNPRPAQSGGAYIVFDMSENMKGVYKEIDLKSLISLTTKQVPDNVDVGLMVIGGVASGQTECERIVQIEALAPKTTSIPSIDRTITQLVEYQPYGISNIELAILKAIDNLSGRSNVQQIIVITSGVDERCGILDRNLINVAANQKKVSYSITVVAVGLQTPENEEKLRRFADYYTMALSANQIPQVIGTVIVEPIFSYYAPGNR